MESNTLLDQGDTGPGRSDKVTSYLVGSSVNTLGRGGVYVTPVFYSGGHLEAPFKGWGGGDFRQSSGRCGWQSLVGNADNLGNGGYSPVVHWQRHDVIRGWNGGVGRGRKNRGGKDFGRGQAQEQRHGVGGAGGPLKLVVGLREKKDEPTKMTIHHQGWLGK